MGLFLRKVKTASGAIAVQIVEKRSGRRVIVEHLGSARDDAELAALMQAGQAKLHQNQPALDLGLSQHGATSAASAGGAVVTGSRSQLLVEVIAASWRRLGFDQIADEAFFQLVLARLVEPTSKLDSLRVIADLGLAPVHVSTVKRCLKRCTERGYRDQISAACFQHVWSDAGGDVSLLLYDVTTLYFEAPKEDEFRKVGYSKERRVDPQIVVGLLVDRSGFPLEIACYEGDQAETRTIIPVVKGFRDRHQIADMVVVADAGMLSADNLTAIDDAQLRFIVGSRSVKAPHDLGKHFHWHGNAFTDGQIIDTVTTRRGTPDPRRLQTRAEPVWNPEQHPDQWRAVWQYSRKRAVRDRHTLTAQKQRAEEIIDGRRQPKKARFVTSSGGQLALNHTSWQRANDLVGLKGYVTNITAAVMPAVDVISSYHALWRVEQSFRMSKSDLAARPIFHHIRDSVEAHLTIVFTALAIARDLQERSGQSLRKIIQTLRPLRHVSITIAGQHVDAEPAIDAETSDLLKRLEVGH